MDLLRPRCDTRLREHIRDIDIQQLSRIPASRIQANALPHIGLVELVSAATFEKLYNPLYLSMFHGGERERSDLIIERLKDDFAGRRSGLSPYRIVGIKDVNGEAIGAAQFSVLMLRSPRDPPHSRSGPRFAVPYVQYIYVRAENRRQDMSEVLHTLVLAVAIADARSEGNGDVVAVPFTLFETEPPNHGAEQTSQANATERTTIHTRSGAIAIMLRSSSLSAEEVVKITSAHVQPGLEPDDKPLTLIWAIRPSPLAVHYDIKQLGKLALAAYYRSLRDEGFPEKNIALAEGIAERRGLGAEFCEMELAMITRDMYQNLDENVDIVLDSPGASAGGTSE